MAHPGDTGNGTPILTITICAGKPSLPPGHPLDLSDPEDLAEPDELTQDKPITRPLNDTRALKPSSRALAGRR